MEDEVKIQPVISFDEASTIYHTHINPGEITLWGWPNEKKGCIDCIDLINKLICMAEYGSPSDPIKHAGICGNLGQLTDEDAPNWGEIVADISQVWPFYSGRPAYPISGGYDYYRLGRTQDSLWAGQQLIHRINLLNFMRAILEVHATTLK